MVLFVQHKKREKHEGKGVTLIKVAGFSHGCFSRFLKVQMVPNRAKRLIYFKPCHDQKNISYTQLLASLVFIWYLFSIIIALKIFVKLTEKNTCANLFCNKVADPAIVIFFKTRSRHRCLPVHFVNFLRASFEFCEFTCEFCKFCEFSEQLFHRTPPDDCFRKLSNFDQYTLLEKDWFQRINHVN